jgi:dihydroorotate dehydrogenase subfamily 1
VKREIPGLNIKSPFTIPSGVITTLPSVVTRIARDVDAVGFLTTKTISLEPRQGYREPIMYEYYPGCFVNAVGLANPGAVHFAAEMKSYLPLYQNKPLVVSIMGTDAREFVACALILDPIADAFELNLSCPHVKGAGQCLGSDIDVVLTIIQDLKRVIRKPVIAKLSPNLGNVPEMAAACEQAGADALFLINTVGPGVGVDAAGNAVLSNKLGGLSGKGVLPIGLKAVAEAAQACKLPIIGAGGISSPSDVLAYQKAGASYFAVGSALAGMNTTQVAEYLNYLASEAIKPAPDRLPVRKCRTEYLKTQVMSNKSVGGGMFQVDIEESPHCVPGQFFFLRIPGVGEKPFSPLSETSYLVRAVGPFTGALEQLRQGDEIWLRGPYGNGFPEIDRAILIGGGTGIAPLVMFAERNSAQAAFFGFSSDVDSTFKAEIEALIPSAHIVVDQPGKVGAVIEVLADEVKKSPKLFEDSSVLMCGPSAMTKAACEALKEVVPSNRIFIAREDVMRCGIGVCGSCGTPTGLRSCIDGPVLAADVEI